MRILIIGGTRFVGRALVEAGLTRGHELTLFHRGQTNPDAFPEVERILGDRDGGLSALGDRTWDAVIDTCGYVPRIVRASAEALRGRVDLYAFISTISVYQEGTGPFDEASPLATLADPTTEEITGETYGGLKVLCEEAVHEVFSDRALIVRPGLIVGPHDPTNRMTYWIQRMAQGGDVLAPGGPQQPVQFIDAYDLAVFTLDHVEKMTRDVFNATGPRLGFGEFLAACAEAAGTAPHLHWASDAFLAEQGVGAWMEMPLWMPGPVAETSLVTRIDHAVAAGLRFRPLVETLRDTLKWVQSLDTPPGQAGMAPEREQELLKALQGR